MSGQGYGQPPPAYQQQQQQGYPGPRPMQPQPGYQQPGFHPAAPGGPPPGGAPAPRPGYAPVPMAGANGVVGPVAGTPRPAQPMQPGYGPSGAPAGPGAPQGMRPPGPVAGAPGSAPPPGVRPPGLHGGPQPPARPPGPAYGQSPMAGGVPRPAGMQQQPPPGVRPPMGAPPGAAAGPGGFRPAMPGGPPRPGVPQQAPPPMGGLAPRPAAGPPGVPGMPGGPPVQQGMGGPPMGAVQPPQPAAAPGLRPPGLGAPPPGAFQPQQQLPPQMAHVLHPGLRPPGAGHARPPMAGMVGPRPPGVPSMGAAPPAMGAPPAVGFGAPPGYEQPGMQAVLDSFTTLSLGPSAPTMPGQPHDGGVNPAAFPRPAGPPDAVHAAAGAPPPYHPANCKPEFVRLASGAVPNSQALKARWHLPFGAVVHPMAESGGGVPVANAGHASIIRCKRCRTYMNPHMVWMDGGRRYACNVCQLVNEVPVEYFSALDGAGRRLDHDQRPELSTGSVEYVAPAEYMVRAPMPPTYVFVIDVSFAAASSGLLGVVCQTIKDSLDSLPGEGRAQVAFVTFDRTLHFYNLKAGLTSPQMMVVGEVDEPFVPLPDDLLVNLRESRGVVEALLDSLPGAFGRSQCVESAMGPALQAAYLLMNHIGGKLLLFQAAAPSLGIGRIKARDNPALYGTDRECTLRTPDDPFYKRFSAEASRFQICVDVFAFGSTYMDLPSLGALPKYTGGQLYYYPGFAADKDGGKLRAELTRNLTRETCWEAVMRIRCSKGLRISAFYGHFFVRSTDLLALPACDADKSFAVEISLEETVVAGPVAYIQSALLYTHSSGERRIRVHTLALPVVADLVELYRHSDAGAAAALLAKTAVERSYDSRLDNVRTTAQQRLAASLREYRLLHTRGAGMAGGVSPNALVLPERLRSLPLLVLGLLKTAALRGTGRDVNTDERTAVGHQVITACADEVVRLAYPACYPVYELAGDWGKEATPGSGAAALPPTTPPGLEYFNPAGAYLIDNGRLIILWLGQQLGPGWYQAAFGLAAPPHDTSGLSPEPPRAGSELSARLCAVLRRLRAGHELHQEVYVVRQGHPLEAHVMPYLVEDRQAAAGSLGYLDFMLQLQKMVMAK